MKQTRNRSRHIINKGQYNSEKDSIIPLSKITAFLTETTERSLFFVLMLNKAFSKKMTKKLI